MKNIKLNYTIKAETFVDEKGNKIDMPVNNFIGQAIIKMPEGVNFDGIAVAISRNRKINEALKDKADHVLLENTEHESLIKALKTHFSTLDIIEPAYWDYIKEMTTLPDAKVEASKKK